MGSLRERRAVRRPDTKRPTRAQTRRRRDLFYPHEQGGPGDIGGAPDVTSVVTRDSAASSESWLAVAPDVLAGAPGLYTLRLRGDTGSPTVEVTVATPGPGVVLAAEASDALAKVAKRCCGPENEKSRFCADM